MPKLTIDSPELMSGKLVIDSPELGAQGPVENKLMRYSKDFATGAISTLEGTARGIQAFAPFPHEKFIMKTIADRAASVRESIQPPDPKFTDMVASGFGSMAGFMIPGTALARVQTAAKFTPQIANWLGATASGTLEALTEAGSTYDRAKEKGMDEVQAVGSAAKAFWLNLPTVVFTNKLGIFGDKGGVIRKALTSMPVEGAQEFTQQVFGNIAVHDPAMQGALESGAVGAIVGGVTGGAMAGLEKATKPKQPLPTQESVPVPAAGKEFSPFKRPALKEALNKPMEQTQGLVKGEIEYLTPEGTKKIKLQEFSGPVRIQSRATFSNIVKELNITDVDGDLVSLPTPLRTVVEGAIAYSYMGNQDINELRSNAASLVTQMTDANHVWYTGTKHEIEPDTKVFWGEDKQYVGLRELANRLKSLGREPSQLTIGAATVGEQSLTGKVMSVLQELYDKSKFKPTEPPKAETPQAPAPLTPMDAAQEVLQAQLAPQAQEDQQVPVSPPVSPPVSEETLPTLEDQVKEEFQRRGTPTPEQQAQDVAYPQDESTDLYGEVKDIPVGSEGLVDEYRQLKQDYDEMLSGRYNLEYLDQELVDANEQIDYYKDIAEGRPLTTYEKSKLTTLQKRVPQLEQHIKSLGQEKQKLSQISGKIDPMYQSMLQDLRARMTPEQRHIVDGTTEPVEPEPDLNDNEEIVGTYRVSVPQDINSTEGVIPAGKYWVVKDSEKAGQVKLANPKNSAWISHNALREMLMPSDGSKPLATAITRERGGILGPLNPTTWVKAIFDALKPVAGNGEEMKIAPEFKNAKSPLKVALGVMRFTQFPGPTVDYLKSIYDKAPSSVKRAFSQPKLQDDVITRLWGDAANFPRYASYVAEDNMKQIQDSIWQQIEEDYKKQTGKVNKKDIENKYKFITWLMFRAGQEVIAPFDKGDIDSNKLKWEPSSIGLGGAHLPSNDPQTPDGEAIAYAEDMMRAHKELGIPVVDKNGNQLNDQQAYEYFMSERQPLSFWNLLGHPNAVYGSESFQKMILTVKTEIQNSLLLDLLETGTYANTDMLSNMLQGFEHGVYDKTEDQKTSSGGPNVKTFGSTADQEKRYRTNSEYAWQTNRKGLVAYDDYITSNKRYIEKSMLRLQQLRTLKWIKELNNPAAPELRIKGFENNQDVNDQISLLKIVEYKQSPVIKQLEKLTKIDANNILEQLGYIQAHNTEGLALRHGPVFMVPYLTRPLYETLQTLYDKGGQMLQPLDWLNRVTAIPKFYITMIPTDSTFRWMSMALMNSSPTELMKIIPDYVKSISKGATQIGPQILTGHYDFHKSFQTEDYKDLGDFIRLGGSVHFAQAVQSLFDVAMKNTMPEMQTKRERIFNFGASFGGINTAIFHHFILRKVFSTWQKTYKHFQQKYNLDREDAMRIAATYVTNGSGMFSPGVFGPLDGKLASLLLFSRTLTVGLMRMMSAASYPMWQGIPGLHKYHTSGTGRTLNPLFWGETSKADMKIISREFQKHLFKMFMAYTLTASALQYALSFVGDQDEPDEHGDTGKKDGKIDPLARRRFMLMNEQYKKMSIRLPWRDWNQRRMYLDPQILREVVELATMIPGLGKGPGQWLRNKLSIGVRQMSEFIMNTDGEGNKIVDPNLSVSTNMRSVKDWVGKNIQIIQFRSGQAGTGDQLVDTATFLLQFFGLGTSRGQAVEPGRNVQELYFMKRKVAEHKFEQRQERDAVDELHPNEIWDKISDKFSGRQAREMFRRKDQPVTTLERDERRAIYR